MEAGTINCPMCGAATSTDKPQCQYCEAILATIACSSCFAMMFVGSKHCPRCGATATHLPDVVAEGKHCPRCRTDLTIATVGNQRVLECDRCAGLWLDTQSFEKVCANTEHQAAVLGNASLVAIDRETPPIKVNYIPCPECSQLMNRVNFARCSGVIIDVCKRHGIWFDRDELSRIVEFIRAGGLELARTKEKNALEEERQRLQQERVAYDVRRDLRDSDRISGIVSTRDLLRLLLR